MFSLPLRAPAARMRRPALLPTCTLIALCWPLGSTAQTAATSTTDGAATLPTTTVHAEAVSPTSTLATSTLDAQALASQRARSSDSASLLRSLPGV